MIGEIVVKLNCKKKKPKKKEKNMNTNFLQTLSNPIRGIFNRKKNKQNQEKKILLKDQRWLFTQSPSDKTTKPKSKRINNYNTFRSRKKSKRNKRAWYLCIIMPLGSLF